MDVSGLSLFRQAGFGGSVYVGIVANTPRPDECIRYLEYLIGSAELP